MSSSREKRSGPFRNTFGPRSTLVEVSADDWLIGKVLDDRYRVERILGEGGMGRVYECTDTRFHRRLVLKTLLPGLASDRTVWPRFLREARAAADIGSPHIVSAVEFGNLDDGRSYYLMELADGITLDEVLEQTEGPLPLDRALRIARDVCRALEAAHDAKIVHRDLKPDNVLLVVKGGRPDFVKIVDFGLALMMNAAVRITGRGEIVGSPYYMSPEQCADEAVDGRADLYALGVILFEMLTLELPFDDDLMVNVLKAKLTERAPPPSTHVPELPAELDALVARCLERRPQDRFASAKELGAALDALIGPDAQPPRRFTTASTPPAALTSSAPPPRVTPSAPPPTPPTGAPPPSMPRRRSALAQGLLVGAVLALIFAATGGLVALVISLLR
ncbi:MAG: serine/threonine-protein kinase [Sandaracinaceae bacterium]